MPRSPTRSSPTPITTGTTAPHPKPLLPGAPKRTWVLRTDSTGSTGITLADKSFNAGEETLPYLVSGDDLYRNAEGAPTVPLGTLIIAESKAPEGYHESNRVALVRFTQNGSEVERSGDLEDASRYGVEGDQAVLVNESVVRGGVSIEKRDAESQLITPLGNASLDSCVFAITNKSDRPSSSAERPLRRATSAKP